MQLTILVSVSVLFTDTDLEARDAIKEEVTMVEYAGAAREAKECINQMDCPPLTPGAIRKQEARELR